jgi:ADP-ribose pyrophosphatase YjhB (NUDIX family)
MELPAARDYYPHIAYDSVIFGFSGNTLKILVMEYKRTGLFALPGGFVRKDEHLDDAVKRGLRDRTGLENIYLEQFHTFGSADRSDPAAMRRILDAHGSAFDDSHWMLDRFFSIAYYALINYSEVKLRPGPLSDSIDWYEMDKLPPLMQDHHSIVDMALEVLRENLDRKLIGGNLLPELFTMKELQSVYESILGEELRRTTFQRKMLSLDILERHEKRYSGKAHKAPYLYSWKKL